MIQTRGWAASSRRQVKGRQSQERMEEYFRHEVCLRVQSRRDPRPKTQRAFRLKFPADLETNCGYLKEILKQ